MHNSSDLTECFFRATSAKSLCPKYRSRERERTQLCEIRPQHFPKKIFPFLSPSLKTKIQSPHETLRSVKLSALR